MEERTRELSVRGHRGIVIGVIEGHFVTQHSHVSHCIDMTRVKSELNSAKEEIGRAHV